MIAPCTIVDDDQWPAEIEHMREGFAGKLNVYRLMANHPALLAAWAPLRQHVVIDNALGAERSEVVILRAAFRLGSAYEWAHHVTRARRLGFSDTRIDSLRGQVDAMAPSDRLVAEAVDALFDDRRIPPILEHRLAEALGRSAVFDLIATVGFYSCLGYLLNTYDPPLDQEIAAELAERPL
ncbi:carboxymuconolactone decarboxylase family protein [Plastorhodobacter daqingensis]|uniref:Carboxymuconolactone decarboxylase family protein n=1 Tax=Plastorhodobacter daqingensis TaxID=1387281 RepID=A0ABW2UK69_9RHOB